MFEEAQLYSPVTTGAGGEVTVHLHDGHPGAHDPAVRSLALFYNKTLLDAAGITTPPQTLDDLVADAKKTVQRDGSGNITTEGMGMDFAGQDHQWWREVLVRQFGGVPYDDKGNVAYNDDAGVKALSWYTGPQPRPLQLPHPPVPSRCRR